MPAAPARTRARTAPLHPRRVSGPTRRPVPVGPPARGRTGAFERLSRLPEHRVVDRLLRSRLWIWVIGILLGGIVAMQVSLLKLNAGISRAVQAQSTLVQDNASLQTAIAGYTTGERVRAAAADENMIDPPAGETRYLKIHPGDAGRAARRMRPPSALARGIMDNGGVVPGSLAPAGTAGAAVAAALAGTGAATTTTVPAGTATTVPTPTGTTAPTGTTGTTGATDTTAPTDTTAATGTPTPAATAGGTGGSGVPGVDDAARLNPAAPQG